MCARALVHVWVPAGVKGAARLHVARRKRLECSRVRNHAGRTPRPQAAGRCDLVPRGFPRSPPNLARMLVNTRRCPETHMHSVVVYGSTGISWFGARHAWYCTFRGQGILGSYGFGPGIIGILRFRGKEFL
eukprot:5272826-Alexandrium_andersonii.AAC.1